MTGSNKNTNIETLFPCNCRSAILNIISSKNDILKVEAQLSALKSDANCELSILRNQIESFTKHTKMSLGHENRNIDALHKNIAFLQNESPEKNKIIKSLMETQTVVLDVMTDLRQQPNTQEQNITEHLSQDKFNQRSHNYRNKDHSREEQRKRNQQVRKEKKIMYVGNLYESETESDLVEHFGLRTTNFLIDNCSIEMSNLQQNRRHNGHTFILAPCHQRWI